MVAPGNVGANEMSAIDSCQSAVRVVRHDAARRGQERDEQPHESICIPEHSRRVPDVSSASAVAQSVPGEVERGRELAERVCSNCHKVKADPAAPVSTDMLSFPSMPTDPG